MSQINAKTGIHCHTVVLIATASSIINSPKTCGLAAECIRESTSGNVSIPIAADKLMRLPPIIKTAATMSQNSIQFTPNHPAQPAPALPEPALRPASRPRRRPYPFLPRASESQQKRP